MVKGSVRYQPGPAFQESGEQAMPEIPPSDSTEFWLIQWPLNHVNASEFDGEKVSLKLHHDGNFGNLESSSGKSYELVSFAAQQPDATVFIPSGSEMKAVGKISRRVCLVRYPEPEELEKEKPSFGSLTPSSRRSAGSSRKTMSRFSGVSKNSNPSMASSPSLTLLLALVLPLISHAVAAPEKHLVNHLPGFDGALPSKHYAGYITVDESHGKRLFYYLVLSERDPAADPVVLWLNGGPGCSSFDGFVYENGPFNFEHGSTPGGLPRLHLNPYSWSKVSSMMYLDSPAGVGMSYSLNKSDYTTGDLKTAADAHTFLLKWFELYPEFQSNPFYISGESYAGIYIPTLADEVVKGIQKALKPRINLKGYLIGNGATDEDYDLNSFVPFAHGMGLISTDLFEDVSAACHGTFWGKVHDVCQENIDRVRWELKDLNRYNILAPCYHHPEVQQTVFVNSSLPSSFRKLGETERPFPVRKRMAGLSWPLGLPVSRGRVTLWPELGGRSLPCTSDELATIWLDDEDVRAAIHAKPKSLIGSWELNTARIYYTHDTGSMVEYHKKFTAMGYRVLIYSGDHDLCIPFTGTEAWVRSLGYRVVDSWRPWHFQGQFAGYTQGYDHNLTFLTIKGSGHTVPEYKPKESLAFYTRWLFGEKI